MDLTELPNGRPPVAYTQLSWAIANRSIRASRPVAVTGAHGSAATRRPADQVAPALTAVTAMQASAGVARRINERCCAAPVDAAVAIPAAAIPIVSTVQADRTTSPRTSYRMRTGSAGPSGARFVHMRG